jgi:hypothetical protein
MTETPPLDAKDFADYLRQHATSQRPNVRAELERIADGTEALRRGKRNMRVGFALDVFAHAATIRQRRHQRNRTLHYGA